MNIVKKRKGITFIEIMVVVAILVLMIIGAVGALNPAELFNRARDAQRKKDLNRIKISFEEYFNDKGCYPDTTMVEKLGSKTNCETHVFLPWLSYWPCDPKGEAYKILIGDNVNCPKWYKVMTLLESKRDTQISSQGSIDSEPITTANYSVSSGNVPDEIETLGVTCWQGGCYYITSSCNWIESCTGSNCYSGNCTPECKTKSCN